MPASVVPKIASLFHGDAVLVESAVSLMDDALFPEELAHVGPAVPKRRAEFATARVCARRALAQLGMEPMALVPRSDRAPTWPSGVVGSITHAGDYCAVVVERSPPALSVGIDVERIRALEPGVRALVLRPSERAWVAEHPAEQHDELGLAFFSAKEAYYKCQYPLTSRYLDFQDVELELDLTAGVFEARAIVTGLPARVARLAGRIVREGDMILTGVELRA